ncbi:hypothetical protein BDZ89DRAFT_1082834 [Hymenopellis radicata]|nr:hypothetical protein BDZ89DRAFT_1082834 [Hymenopellis radicata]
MPVSEHAQKKARVEEIATENSDIPTSTGRDLFSTLPTELVLLIIDFNTTSRWYDRHDTLFALSRTCTHLRAITLEETWSVFDTTRKRGPRYRSLECVVNQSKVLTELPHVHPYPSGLSPFRSLAVLVPCLAKLTNVTKMEVLGQSESFPHVRELVVGVYGHNFLRCCTGVRSITDESIKLLAAITVVGQGVEELRGFRFDGHDLKKLLPNTPNLRVLQNIMLGKFHNLLASSKQLTHIGVSGAANQAFIDALKERYVVEGN